MVSPPSGTSRNARPVAGGEMRNPSRMTAWRYGSFRASESLMGLEIVAVDSSERRVE